MEYLDAGFFPAWVAPLVGVFVNLSAIRNFQHLSKSDENPGMFVKGRTFSRNFVVENFWFQIFGGTVLLMQHPPTRAVIGAWGGFVWIISVYYLRELFPKTSYVSWDSGNKEVNKKRLDSKLSVLFISIQVKLVRWNFVFKKYYCMYLAMLPCMEDTLGLPVGTYLPLQERRITSYMTLDAMHNVTTAFFLQTLKFHQYISPTTFSILFNATPIIMFFVTMREMLFIHHHILPFFIAMMVDLTVNLMFIYPSSLSPQNKNRLNTSVKALGFLCAHLVLRSNPIAWISSSTIL